MTNYSVKDVSSYISAAPKEARPHLKKIRATVTSAVPKAEEKISWGKPYYRYYGMLGGFDAFKNHVTFEVWTDVLRAEERKFLEEKGYKTGKRTFQIRYDQRVPTTIIKKLLQAQVKTNKVKSDKK